MDFTNNEIPNVEAPPPPVTPPDSPIAPPRRNRRSQLNGFSTATPHTLPLQALFQNPPKGILSPETPYEQPLSANTAEPDKVRVGRTTSRPFLTKDAHVLSGDPVEEEAEVLPPPVSKESRLAKIGGVALFPVVKPGDISNQTSIEQLIRERRIYKSRPPPPPPKTAKPALQPIELDEDEEKEGGEKKLSPTDFVRSLTQRSSVVSEETQKKLETEKESVAIYRISSQNSVVEEAAKVMSEARENGQHQSLTILNPGFGLEFPTRGERIPSRAGYERLSPSTHSPEPLKSVSSSSDTKKSPFQKPSDKEAATEHRKESSPKESLTTVISVGPGAADRNIQIPVTHFPAESVLRTSSAPNGGYEQAMKKEKVGPRRSVQRADAVDLDSAASSSGYVNIVPVPSPPVTPSPLVLRIADPVVSQMHRISLNAPVPVLPQAPAPGSSGWRPTPKPRRLVNTKQSQQFYRIPAVLRIKQAV
ncbi:hypothetical protein L596_024150 [Steinernema carpocapsae]|uniref:Uncharacterized protein n=1 Tax=Steinernema carpocapsae TaxID=34508 RepID=A0A4U5MFW4_STECR|nr:hypothetical protein L596_024150 [Steinernema carpocapsae]